MTPQINFSLVIVFLILYSSCSSPVLKGYNNINYHKKGSYRISYENSSNHIDLDPTRASNGLLDSEKIQNAYTSGENSELRDKNICCPSYQNKTRICPPQCPTACNNGNCTHPNTCKCNDTGEEVFYDETFICFIAQSSMVQITAKEKNVTDKRPDKLKAFKECLPECRAECNSTFNNIIQSKIMAADYCWIPIQSSCNIAKSSYWDILIKHKYYMIGGVAIVIILLAMIICICCILRRKKKRLDTKEIAGSYEMFAFSDIPLRSRYPDYMEDNSIYS